MRGLAGIILGALGMSSIAWGIQDPAQLARQARNDLSQKLLKLSSSLDMKEAKYGESKGSGKDYDANTGNSFLSNSTIHYTVESTCREWVGQEYCRQWLDPFIPEHGFGSDYSPLEGVVAHEWMSHTADGTGQYRIWKVTRAAGGPNTDANGKFDRSGIQDWRLLPDVQKKVEAVGEATAVRQIALTYDDNAPKGQRALTMPNMESLRMMASRWTKMLRNRLVSNLADMRVGDSPTEFLQNEDIPDCEAYVKAMQTQQEETRTEDRLQMQGRLEADTVALGLQQRYQACMALRKASVYAVNPVNIGGRVIQGDPNLERIDKWRTRANIAMIDKVGININSIPKPDNAQVTRRDITSKLAVWEEGGRAQRGVRRLSNRQQIQSYNNQLDLAATAMASVAARSPQIANNGAQIRSFKIRPGEYNAIRLNSLTPQMRKELSQTPFAQSGVMQNGGPEGNLEDNATQISTTGR